MLSRKSRSFNASLAASAAVLLSAAASASAESASVAWRTNLDAAKIEAADSGRLLMLHFSTTWCGPCRTLDKKVFSQPQFGPAVEQNFVPVKIDGDKSPALVGAFRVDRYPTDVILSPQGTVVAKFGCPNTTEEYLKRLGNLATAYRQTAGAGKGADAQASINPAYAGLKVTQPAQPAAAQAKTATRAPVNTPPQVTNNPYLANRRSPQGPHSASPAAASGEATMPTAVSNPAGSRYAQTTPTLPAGAMPQSYRKRYAPAPAAAGANANPSAPPTAVAARAASPGIATPRQGVTQQAVASPPAATQVGPTEPPAPATVAATGSATSPSVGQSPGQSAVESAPQSNVPITPTPRGPAEIVQARPAADAGDLPFGFDGFCPVTLKFANKWVKGRADVGMEHRGRVYLFAGEKEREQFAVNPDAYSPVFSGLDPVLMLDENQAQPGSRRYGYKYLGAFYLFSSEETKQRFAANPDAYATGVRQAMRRIDGGAGGVIRR